MILSLYVKFGQNMNLPLKLGLITVAFAFVASSARSENLGTRLDARVSGHTMTGRVRSSRLAGEKMDDREEIQTVRHRVAQPPAEPTRRRDVSSEMRQRKTRNVVDSQR